MELRLDTTSEAVDWVSTLLAAVGYTGELDIQPYVTSDQTAPAASASEPEWHFTICLLFPYNAQSRSQTEQIMQRLSPLQRTGMINEPQLAVVEEKPAHLADSAQGHRIGKRFIVLSPDAAASKDDVVLRLEKSLAFGSGLHPATIACLRLLERQSLEGMQALDLGSGSGILSVAMAKLGAQVLALDNDRVAVEATQAAVRCNAVEQQVTAMAGSLGRGSDLGHWLSGETVNDVPTIQPIANFDLIVANILARVHITLAPDFRLALRQTKAHAGVLITGGFTTDYEDEVHLALAEAGFEKVDCERIDEWVVLAHQLKPKLV
jgi:ribosomal protein L11 methyltransferase